MKILVAKVAGAGSNTGQAAGLDGAGTISAVLGVATNRALCCRPSAADHLRRDHCGVDEMSI